MNVVFGNNVYYDSEETGWTRCNRHSPKPNMTMNVNNVNAAELFGCSYKETARVHLPWNYSAVPKRDD